MDIPETERSNIYPIYNLLQIAHSVLQDLNFFRSSICLFGYNLWEQTLGEQRPDPMSIDTNACHSIDLSGLGIRSSSSLVPYMLVFT